MRKERKSVAGDGKVNLLQSVLEKKNENKKPLMQNRKRCIWIESHSINLKNSPFIWPLEWPDMLASGSQSKVEWLLHLTKHLHLRIAGHLSRLIHLQTQPICWRSENYSLYARITHLNPTNTPMSQVTSRTYWNLILRPVQASSPKINTSVLEFLPG